MAKPIEISIGGLITQTVTDQSGLKTITYVNGSGKIEVQADVKEIDSEGGLGASTTGTLVGNILVELVGGALEWK